MDPLKTICEPLRRGIERKKFTLTEVQRKALLEIPARRRVILISPTGTGKTEAALWPVITEIYRKRGKPISIVYVTPLRALNRDLEQRIRFWCDLVGLRVDVRHGDTSPYRRRSQALSPPDVLITTPETLQVLLIGKRLREGIKNVKWIIVDEVHELVDDKRGVQLSVTLRRLMDLLHEDPGIILLSATVPNPELVRKFFLGNSGHVVISNPEREVILSVEYPKPGKEGKSRLGVDEGLSARIHRIIELIRSSRACLIFTNTRSTAEALANKLNHILARDHMKISVHHSSLSRESREETERMFRRDELDAVVATSSLELGIDIGSVDLVVQYMSPRQAIRILQRVGRASHRPGEPARGVIIADGFDDFLESLVLARRACEKNLEPIRFFRRPLDVLSHQLVGETIMRRKVSLMDFFIKITELWPYEEISIEDLREVARFLSSMRPRLLWYNEERDEVFLGDMQRVMEYYFGNLSTIPDVKTIPVYDESSGFFVGSLDENFVAEYIKPGIKFVFRGSIWRVKEVGGGKVLVTPDSDLTGAIPSWAGEEIPVDRETAEVVGKIKFMVYEMISEGVPEEEIVSNLTRIFPFTEKDCLIEGIKPLLEHIKRGFPVPSDRSLVLESVGDVTVIHSHLGTLINRALARTVAYMVLKNLRIPVRVYADPYHIFIIGISGEAVASFLKNALLREVDEREVARSTGFYAIRLVQVARRFGAIRRDADITRVGLKRLIEAYRGTIIDKEALNEVFTLDLDFDGLEKVRKAYKGGQLGIIVSPFEQFSPLALEGLIRSPYLLEIAPPDELMKRLLDMFKRRLLRTQIFVVCSNCWQWGSWISISALTEIDTLKCPVCGDRRLAGFHGRPAGEAMNSVELSRRKGRPSVKNAKLANVAYELGLLTQRYGNLALVCAGARALDLERLREILERHKKLSDSLLLDLAKMESDCINLRTKAL